MATKTQSIELPLQGKIVEEAGRKAVRDAKLLHKQTGHPIVVWKDGKVVEIPPEEIVIDEDE
jgi:hypothetical protein